VSRGDEGRLILLVAAAGLLLAAIGLGCVAGLSAPRGPIVQLASWLFFDWFSWLGLPGWLSTWCRNAGASIAIIVTPQLVSNVRIGRITAPQLIVAAALIANGLMPGLLVGSVAARTGIAVWPFVTHGLLPHGIVELPVFIWACCLAIEGGAPAERRRLTGWHCVFTRLGTFVPVGMPALLIAAVVEDTITPLLLERLF